MDEIQYFQIRQPGKDVIAIWKKEKAEYHLEMVNPERYGVREAQEWVTEISESEFAMLDEVCKIPQIYSDGVYNRLGTFKWKDEIFGGARGLIQEVTVYAVVHNTDTLDVSDLVIETATAVSQST